MLGVKTYYKPTQRRGKQLIYASIDPAERKGLAVIDRFALPIFVLLLVILWLL